ncbi:L-threo-3-hydroxyaspartate ammonia-lyase [Polaribacter huanghezhanensis]|uniref:threonine/serine dehydratase n=1 Tax=Polaribacter huanghezhanensis TaxID=1354726 RepID=UPI00264A1CB9|nr:threonine/serine dehydratase [Polaribacter huanghezhanensis]WKD86479.1 L-threo-3-hydroxyaspartate ammonia-lyase [Polaribacter huanghezhanensis]
MQHLLNVYKRIQPHIHKTPVLHSRLLNEATNANVFLKCENFQKTGSYKIRGASNAILNLSKTQRNKGVVTHSSGNFAQALSLAAKNLGVKAYIVMPSSAPEIKRKAVLDYGGIVTISEPTLAARELASEKIRKETGATFIHPSNNIDVIDGQGTACYELLQSASDFDYMIAPIGGGGLIAGTCLFANAFSPSTKVIGAEPLKVDDAYRSLKSGKIETNKTANTIADGLKTQLGNHNFPIILKHVTQIIRVTEDEIIAAMRFVWERMKITIEPSSAVAVAAIFKEPTLFKNKKVGVLISGGNVDITKLPF